MNFILRYMPERLKYLNGILEQIQEITILCNKNINSMQGFLRSLELSEDNPTVFIEDDIILCDNFMEKILKEIEKRPNDIIQFFSMRKNDISIGSRYEPGRTFCMNQCFYLPKNYASSIFRYYSIWDRKKTDPTAYDYLISDWMNKNKLNYYIVVPSLVQHAIEKSLINPKRSSKRQSITFSGINDRF